MKKVLVICIAFAISCTTTSKNVVPKENLDFTEEFNTQTISHDRANATMLMAVYDTTTKKYVFEFIDN